MFTEKGLVTVKSLPSAKSFFWGGVISPFCWVTDSLSAKSLLNL